MFHVKPLLGRLSMFHVKRSSLVGILGSIGRYVTETMIRSVLEEMGIAASGEQLALLCAHLQAVLRANALMNLTAIIDQREASVLHIADSLTALPLVASARPGWIVDLGSGAGYPGIPLAVMSRRSVLLVEARKKKAAFLADTVRQLCIPAEVSALRAEELALERPAAFAVAVARALAPLPSLVELAAPLLALGGTFIALKGAPLAEEVERGDQAASKVGLERVGIEETRLPGRPDRRTLVMYQRVSPPSIRLPRGPGLAQREPIA